MSLRKRKSFENRKGRKALKRRRCSVQPDSRDEDITTEIWLDPSSAVYAPEPREAMRAHSAVPAQSDPPLEVQFPATTQPDRADMTNLQGPVIIEEEDLDAGELRLRAQLRANMHVAENAPIDPTAPSAEWEHASRPIRNRDTDSESSDAETTLYATASYQTLSNVSNSTRAGEYVSAKQTIMMNNNSTHTKCYSSEQRHVITSRSENLNLDERTPHNLATRPVVEHTPYSGSNTIVRPALVSPRKTAATTTTAVLFEERIITKTQMNTTPRSKRGVNWTWCIALMALLIAGICAHTTINMRFGGGGGGDTQQAAPVVVIPVIGDKAQELDIIGYLNSASEHFAHGAFSFVQFNNSEGNALGVYPTIFDGRLADEVEADLKVKKGLFRNIMLVAIHLQMESYTLRFPDRVTGYRCNNQEHNTHLDLHVNYDLELGAFVSKDGKERNKHNADQLRAFFGSMRHFYAVCQ